MNLKQLQNLVNNANTMGFNPEDVEVKINYYFSELKLVDMKSEVKAGEAVKPVVKIDVR